MWVAFVALFTLLGSGVLIGCCLGVAAILVMYSSSGTLTGLIESAWQIMFNFSLAAIPCYMLLGQIFTETGLSSKVYSSLAPFLERFPPKLLMTNTVVCAIFGAISGSSTATAAAVGSVAYPELTKRGYDRQTTIGNLAGSGTLGLLIPPSFTLILYGAFCGVSVGDLFISALIPGIVLTLLFLTYLMILCRLKPHVVPRGGEVLPLGRALLATKDVWPMAILIFCVLGTIYLGMATPVEAAGLAVVAAIGITTCLKTFSLKKLFAAGYNVAAMSSMLGLVVVGAIMFSTAVATTGLPRQVITGIQASGLSTMQITLLIYLVYLILGCLLDPTGMLLMTLPFTYPLMMSIGWDPLWFGVMLVIVTEMGELTPPVGLNLYVLQGVTQGEVNILQVARGSIPYFLLQGVLLAIITIFPHLCLWLPSSISY